MLYRFTGEWIPLIEERVAFQGKPDKRGDIVGKCCMTVGIQRTRLYRLFNRMVIGTVICVGACAFPVTLFAADMATEKAVKEAVEKAAEKVVEKAAEEAAEKEELTAKRPDELQKGTEEL